MTVLIESFKQFMAQVRSSQHLFWCQDDVYLTQLMCQASVMVSIQLAIGRLSLCVKMAFHMFFDLEHQGHLYEQIELALIGRHNVLNAAAVFGLSLILGVPEASVRQTFKTFKGILRRCENKGTFDDVHFLDDYAHHPTEIQTTLKVFDKPLVLSV